MAKIPVGKRITSRDLESSQYPNVFRYVQHSDGKTGILVEDGFQFEETSPEALEGIQAAQSAATQAYDIASAAQATAQEARGNALAETLAFSYVEHRYARATAQPDTPMGVDPVGWTLTVPAGTETVWLSYASRRGDGAMLSAWSTPATRMDSHPWMIFKRSATAPETPSGANPAGWYFAPPAGLEPLWASSGRFVYEGGAGAGVVRPHLGLRPRVGLRLYSPSWSTPYLAVNATTGRNSRYLGKFTTHPLSRAGDTWLIYGVGDTPVQRGVWINESGTRRRLASESAADSLYIAQALTDILEVANAGYGVVSDYGAVTFIANLASNAAFIDNLVADTAFIDTLSANVAFVDELTANSAFIDNLVANNTFVANLAAKNAFLEKIVTMSIILNGGEIRSSNFSAGVSGFRLKSDGSAEFGSGVFRGFVNSGITHFAALADWQTMNLSGSMGIVVAWGGGDYGNAVLPVNVAAVLYSVSSYYTAGTFVTRIEFNPLMNASFIRKITVTEPYKSTEVLQYGVSGVGVNYGGYTCIKII